MRKLLVLGALCATLLAGSGPATAADECDGLMVCVPVAGPWVVVPTSSSVPRPTVSYQLRCPRGFIVGGVDARLSDRAIDVTYIARLGSPVSPGITTARSIVFVARYVGATAQAPTFRPFIGCMPAAGGGRIPTAVGAVVKPGDPTILRVTAARVRPGPRVIASSCRGNETLVDASHALAFRTAQPPTASVVGLVRGRTHVSGRRSLASVRGDAELGNVRALVQVHALCSRVR